MLLICHPDSPPTSSGNTLFWHCFLDKQYLLWYTSALEFSDEEIRSQLDSLDSEEDLYLGPSYSFILWDKKLKKHWVQVDEFATCPLFFFASKGFFYVTDIFKELVDLCNHSLKINQDFVQEYLQPFATSKVVHNQTVYDEIERILPQHRLLIDINGNFVLEHYLKNWIPKYKNHHPDEIVQHVRDHFIASINQSTASNNQVAANLSGGLDSSSIVSNLLHLNRNVRALYAVIDGKEADESLYIQAIEVYFSNFYADKIPVPPAKYSSVQSTTILMGQPDGMAAPSALHIPLFAAVKENNISLFFSGHGGDSIIGTNEFYSSAIWENQNFQVLNQWKTSSHFRFSHYLSAWIKASTVWREKGILFFLTKQFKCFLHGVLPVTNLKIFAKQLIQIPRERSKPFLPKIKQLQTPIGLTSEQKKHWESHFSQITITANELLYVLGRTYGTKVVFPLQDFDLFEWALCFSSERNFALGARRGLLREAMKGILPEKIRQRTSKATFTTYLCHSLRNLLQAFPEKTEMTFQENLFISKKEWAKWKITKEEVLKNKKVSMKQIEQCFKITYFLIWLNNFPPSS